MQKCLIVIALIFLSACTSTWRIRASIETDDAARYLESRSETERSQPVAQEQTAPETRVIVTEEEESSNVLEEIRKALP
jgi:hypothetical protein